MSVLQFRGPITYCVLQWCHPMLTGTQRRTSCSTRMITLYGDHVIKLDSGPRTVGIKVKHFVLFIIKNKCIQSFIQCVVIFVYIWPNNLLKYSPEVAHQLNSFSYNKKARKPSFYSSSPCAFKLATVLSLHHNVIDILLNDCTVAAS